MRLQSTLASGWNPVVDLPTDSVLPSLSAEFELDVSGQRWTWSASMFDIMGIAQSNQPSTALLLSSKHPDDRLTTQQMIAQALASRQGFFYESRLVRNDGQLRVVQTTGKIACSPCGSPLALEGTVVVHTDWDTPTFDEHRTEEVGDGHLSVALLARLESAHTYVFRKYAPLVAKASGQVLNNRDQIEDVVQSVFQMLWQHPARFSPDRGSLATFLRLQGRTRSIDLVRAETSNMNRLRRYADETDTGSHSDESTFAKSDITQALRSLPYPERVAIELAFFEGMTYRMVAAHLGEPEGTIKSRIRSGLFRLRSKIRSETVSSPTSERQTISTVRDASEFQSTST